MSMEEAAERLVDDINEYGEPFLRQFRTLDSVISWLRARKRGQHENGALAVAEALSGQTGAAISTLNDYITAARSQVAPLSNQSWGFVRAFSDYFHVGQEIGEALNVE